MVEYIIIRVIDFNKPELGIQEVRYIDALKMRYVRKEKKKQNNGGGNVVVNTRLAGWRKSNARITLSRARRIFHL